MDQNFGPDDLRIAFLAPFTPAENTFLGGLLVTNRLGRPLEFQCTEPVEPNRTQVLLYGPTLRPYIFTELIGRTLVGRTSIRPHLVLVDAADVLPLRELVDVPVACIGEEGRPGSERLGRQPVEWNPGFPADCDVVRTAASHIPDDADLAEPFERVRAALREALGSAAPRNRVA